MSGDDTRDVLKLSVGGLNDAALLVTLCTALDADEQAMNTQLARQLMMARRTARRDALSVRHRATGAPALVAVAVAALLFKVVPTTTEPGSATSVEQVPSSALRITESSSATIPVLLGSEDMEFYGSVEFLLWLEQQRG